MKLAALPLALALGACANEPPRPDATLTLVGKGPDGITRRADFDAGFTLFYPCEGDQLLEVNTAGLGTRSARAVIAISGDVARLMSVSAQGPVLGHDAIGGVYEERPKGRVTTRGTDGSWEDMRVSVVGRNGASRAPGISALPEIKVIADGRFYKIASYGLGGRVDCPAA